MKLRLSFFLFLFPVILFAAPLYSPTWGFWLDLPEGYELVDGNNVDRYSFQGPGNVMFDIAVYNNAGQNVGQLSDTISRRLGNSGDSSVFEYNGKAAVLMELRFGNYKGWGLCIELRAASNGSIPLMAALAYGEAGAGDKDLFHISALDSLAPSDNERRCPGPVTEFTWPRGEQTETAIAGTALRAMFREHDAEGAQALIEREFMLLCVYQGAQDWKEAWVRYYRAIYRDSWDRITEATAAIEWNWNKGMSEREFAEKVLTYVQDFKYERDLSGSDFVNLVDALIDGRGDCDCRAMLWAIILMHADIPAAMMVSRDYSHAMGLADLGGNGARFEYGGINWLVAETTAHVAIGLIGQDMSNSNNWLGILFN